jgi:uncharacterized RDD family membrane protein YckC
VPGRAGPATDDGVPLAGWWWRVLARLVDGLVVVALATVASRPAMGELLGYVREQYDGALSAGVSGEFVWATPSDAVLRAAYVLSVAQLVIGVLYEIGFLMWRSATPGKLLVGLRVRRWADGGRLDLTTVAKRVLASQIASAAPQVGPVYQLVDCLWPLRDRRRQALHDKLARSCVVRPRR